MNGRGIDGQAGFAALRLAGLAALVLTGTGCPGLPEPKRDTRVEAVDTRDEDLGVADAGPGDDAREGRDGDAATNPDTDVMVAPGGCAGGCDDGEACTDDRCVAGACVHAARVGGCDDRDACTEADRCVAGRCTGDARRCDDGEACTDDRCVAGACVHAARAGECDDGNACTTDDACRAGRCAGFVTKCDDANPCTDDYCEATAGCVTRPNRAACDDGDSCTGEDRCVAGRCEGVAASCCIEDADCGEGDACVAWRCVAGRCEVTARCDDGDSCTRDRCEGGACVFGAFGQGLGGVDDFEGDAGWVMSSSNASVGWRLVDGRLACGADAGTYDHGATRATAAREVELPPGAEWLEAAWEADLDDGESCVYDDVVAVVDGVGVGRLCATGAGRWRLDVQAWAGRVVTLEFVFDTRDGLRNSGRGVWLDELVVGGRADVCR